MESLEAQINANCTEYCLSLRDTLNAVNLHREDQDGESFALSFIHMTVAALNTKLLKVSTISQGSKDATSLWASAKKNWATQLLVRLGNTESIDSDNIFNWSKKQSLTMEQVAWWDETHRKFVIGGMGRALEYCINFTCDQTENKP